MSLLSVNGFDAGGQRYQNAATPTAITDAVPQGYIAYDLGNLGQAAKPDAGILWLDFVAVRKFSFALGLAGSRAIATAAATAAATFNVSLNGTVIGSFVFAANATTATFSSVTNATLTVNPGDRLQVTTPGTQDSTLSGVTATLAALRAI